jgi:hypothetical protein
VEIISGYLFKNVKELTAAGTVQDFHLIPYYRFHQKIKTHHLIANLIILLEEQII